MHGGGGPTLYLRYFGSRLLSAKMLNGALSRYIGALSRMRCRRGASAGCWVSHFARAFCEAVTASSSACSSSLIASDCSSHFVHNVCLLALLIVRVLSGRLGLGTS